MMEKLISLIDINFGKGYSSAYFEKGELKSGYVFLSNEEQSAYLIFSEAKDQSYLNIETTNAYVLNLAVVDKSAQGQGKGSELLKFFLQRYSSHDIYIPLWIYDHSDKLMHWFIKHGAELLQSFNEYWKQDSLEKGYECLQCGAPPCLCRMDLYVIKAR
jgi:GNAT superfamily N-acetyltransferase